MNFKEILKKSGKQLVWQLFFAVIVVVLLLWVSLKFLQLYTAHGKFVVVPDLTNKSLTEVQILLEEQDLRCEVDRKSVV